MIKKSPIVFAFLTLTTCLFPQKKALESLLSDSVMAHAEASFGIIDANSARPYFEYNPVKSFIPASVMKLITTSANLELLFPE